ncbi:hypothetical protein TCAL_15351, partial [Tigriopus californicus]
MKSMYRAMKLHDDFKGFFGHHVKVFELFQSSIKRIFSVRNNSMGLTDEREERQNEAVEGVSSASVARVSKSKKWLISKAYAVQLIVKHK